MRKTFVAVMFAVLATAAPGQQVPEPIKDLAPLLDKPTEFVDALRAWGKAQVSAAMTEMEEAKQLAQARKMDDAKAKRNGAQAKVKAVREAYEFGLSKYLKDAKLHNAYGELLYDQFDETPGALKEWNVAIDLDPKYAPPYNNLGLDQCHTGNYEIGLRNLEKALDLDPKNPDFMFNIAQIYLINFPEIEKIKKWKPKKIYDQAMKLSKKATELAPDDYQLAEDYAVNFFAAENFKLEADWAEAVAAWQHARPLANRPDRVFFTWLNEARCQVRAGNNEAAKPCLLEALKIVPDSPVAKQLLDNLSAAKQPATSDTGKKKKHKK